MSYDEQYPSDDPHLQCAFEIHTLEQRIAVLEAQQRAAVEMLEQIVATDETDRGVVLLSSEGSATFDPQLNCMVYDCEHFSPLGDALIALWEFLKPSTT